MKVTLYLPPCAKARPRFAPPRHGRARGHAYMPKEYMEWRALFAQQWHNTVPPVTFTKPVSVTTTVYTKTGNMRQDSDNVHSAILDALQDVKCLRNDRIVKENHCFVFKGVARLEIEITDLPPV